MKKVEQLMTWIGGILVLGTVVLALVALVQVVTHAVSRPGPETVQIASGDDSTAPAEQTETSATAPTESVSEPAPAAPAGPVVTVAAGETAFRQCKACHTTDAGGRNGTGPNLYGIVGRGIASVDGFSYSDALTGEAGDTWTPERLEAFLADPRGTIPGNRMAYGGLRKLEDRQSVIAYLAAQSDTPQTPEELGFASGEAAPATETAAEPAEVEIDPVPWPEGVTYRDPAPRSAEEQAAVDERVAALQAEVDAGLDYERARYHPLHFPPAIDTASNEECLVCHQEIMDHKPREASPAGVPAEDTIAWYQTLDTYWDEQSSFHYRHLQSDYAQMVMNLECSFCHQGNDPREESPDMMITREPFSADASPEFTLRKMVNPSETCLLCHGTLPDPENIMGLAGEWHEVRADMEWPEAPNGCLSCHADLYRTVRHNVDYLKAHSIEEIARVGSSDTCYGCHGGRAWYRISYPYPRHDWPGMFDDELPEWAEGRPTESDPRYQLPDAQTAAE